ncbi:MAG: carboxymuconolactone decarboxylase family protein [Myxococcales bacterium]|nr:carboxymuconolactone decarboxylase family protein [Myxococcales bacterium]
MLSDRDLRLIRLFSSIVLGQWDEVRAIRQDAPQGEPDRGWRETILMVHLFAGFPRTIEAFDVITAEGDLGGMEPEEIRLESDQPELGTHTFGRVYADGSDGVQEHLHHHHPDLLAWIIGHVYGRVLSRPGLSLATRELLAVAALASLGQDRQLASHARGAVRCGASLEELDLVIDNLSSAVCASRRERARAVATKFARRA